MYLAIVVCVIAIYLHVRISCAQMLSFMSSCDDHDLFFRSRRCAHTCLALLVLLSIACVYVATLACVYVATLALSIMLVT